MSDLENSTMASSNTPPEEKKKNDKVIFIIIIALLVGVIGFLFYRQNKQADTIKTQEAKIHAASISIKNLQAEYDSAINRLTAMQGENDSLNKIIEEQIQQLKVAKAGAASAYGLQISLNDYKKQIKDLHDQMDGYLKTIDALTADNKVLNDKVKTAQAQNDQLQSTVSAQQSTISGQQIKLALLHPSALKAEGMKEGKKPKVQKSAKATDYINVTMTIPENKDSDAGDKTFVIRIMDPKGTTLTSNISGQFKSSDGTDMQYSMKATMKYDQSAKTVSMKYTQSTGYTPGKYNIEVYQDGFKVGATTLDLK